MLEAEYWALAVAMGLRTLDEAIFFAIGDITIRNDTVFVYSDGSTIIVNNGIPVPINETIIYV